MKWKPFVYRLLGQRPPLHRRVDLDSLERNWTFSRSRPDFITMLVRLIALRRSVPAPANMMLKPVTARPRWIVYFIYAPDGRLNAAQRFTIARLQDSDAGLAIVCAARAPADMPAELRDASDALFWKALSGFDFSGYALALSAIATHSPGADVLVMNDSVLGPFCAADDLWPLMRWDLTGFTASAEVENHIQSYAFHLRNVTPARLRRLRSIFSVDRASENYRDTVYGKETLFAARASRFMSVGALWYADNRRSGDPSVFAALPLLNAGFPFLKRSVLGRNARFYDPIEVIDHLRKRGHPQDDLVTAAPDPALRSEEKHR